MNWVEILKADPCTLEAKERLYRVLETMGANNDLLHSFKDLDSDELRDMIEEFSTTAMESQRQMFKQMLRDWDMCLVQSHRNPNAPPISSEHSQESMMYKRAGQKSKKIQGRPFKQALEDTVDMYIEDEVFELIPNDEHPEGKNPFWDTLKERYITECRQIDPQDKFRNPPVLGNYIQHANARINNKSLMSSGILYRYLRTLGYEALPYPKYGHQLTKQEWKNRFWSRP